MDVVRYPDPSRFVETIGPWLTETEGRNNLILGISGSLVRRPEVYEEFHLWAVHDADEPVAAAAQTPPYNIVLAESASEAAIAALAVAALDDRETLPGVVGNRPAVDWFIKAWTTLTGDSSEVHMRQGVFELEVVASLDRPDGSSRIASLEDIEALLPWMIAFQDEANPGIAPTDPTSIRRNLEFRLDSNPASGMWVWEVGDELVSASGYGGPTPNGIRIGPVYTPPEHRGKGYASALVAEQSQHLLDAGRRFCFLYTDLSNPTSNAIYERIGYRKVAESAEVRFTTPAT